jgi:geranylgeranyl diphosphate synthase, type II
MIKTYQKRIEAKIKSSIEQFGEKNKLRDACEYALRSGGKRLRPILSYLVAEAIGKDLDVTAIALGGEFAHTASLIADDLPCMDNEDQRRNKPSLHRVYGETTALLASFSLITAAFEKIHENTMALHRSGYFDAAYCDRAGIIVLESATKCSGISGLVGGQFLDMFPKKPSLETLKELIYKKTVVLFELSLVGGWVFGGGSLDDIPLVKRIAYHLGMAFQIADDLGDKEQDLKYKRANNLVHLIGEESAHELFEQEFSAYLNLLRELELDTPAFAEVNERLQSLVFN